MNAEDLLAFQIKAAGLPEPVRQYYYARPRKLRADFSFPEHRLLIEIQGGIFMKRGGAHGSITGILADLDRLNAATLAGFYMLRFTPDQVKTGEALAVIEKALEIYR